jgi:hypothetical protein
MNDTTNTTRIFARHNLPLPAATGDDFEERAYPNATPEVKNWLREQRGLVRAFLASDYGRTQATAARSTAGNRAASATVAH